MADVALATFAAHNLPDGVEASLDSDATFDPVNFNYPHGTHLCAMEVDTETGQVKMRGTPLATTSATSSTRSSCPGRCTAGSCRASRRHRGGVVYDDLDAGGPARSSTIVPDRGRHDQLRPRPHDLAGDHQHARHQGRRRGGHDRLDAGRRERGRRRRTTPRDQRHPDALYAGTGVEGDQRRLGRRDGRDRGRGRAATDAATGMEGTVNRTAGADNPEGGNQ